MSIQASARMRRPRLKVKKRVKLIMEIRENRYTNFRKLLLTVNLKKKTTQDLPECQVPEPALIRAIFQRCFVSRLTGESRVKLSMKNREDGH